MNDLIIIKKGVRRLFMELDIKKLEQDINKVRNEMNILVKNNLDYNRFCEQSIVADEIVIKYLEAKRYLGQ